MKCWRRWKSWRGGNWEIESIAWSISGFDVHSPTRMRPGTAEGGCRHTKTFLVVFGRLQLSEGSTFALGAGKDLAGLAGAAGGAGGAAVAVAEVLRISMPSC